MTSLNLNYLLKDLSLNTVTLGIRALSYDFFEEGHNSVHNIYFTDFTENRVDDNV